MSLTLNKHKKFSGRAGPVLLVIADGVGVAPDAPSNAVTQARTPTLDKLTSSDLYRELSAHGTAVGLPSDDDMGNSEVGHNALGAGRIFAQGAKLVNQALDSGSLFANEVWQNAIAQANNGNVLHFIGLHSDGNIHSHNKHLYTMLAKAAAEGIREIRIHALLDGRDVPARSAVEYLQQTEQLLSELNQQYGVDYRIASGGGRMSITMDRYEADWDMVKRGYDCHVHGLARPFSSAIEAVETMYEESDKGDQYLEAFVITDQSGEPVGTIKDNDVVVFYNFRGDRAMEISQAFESADFSKFDRGVAPDVFYAGMLQYDGDEQIPEQYLVDPPQIDRTMCEFLCTEGVKSFAISETQKYGHVTYFWNGNRSGYIDESLETYVEIPSDNIEFNEKPAMKAREITEETIKMLRSGEFRFGRLNFANGDMVGHTGDLQAAIESMEVVDECVAKLLKVIEELGGVLVYTADHGNADIMYTEKNGVKTPKTSHTLSPVPFAIHDTAYANEYKMAGSEGAGLTNVAATLFNLLGYEAPSDYQPSVIDFA